MTNQKLRVYWIPQVPMHGFEVEVASVEEGVKIMDILARYDAFQFENNIKPDYSNIGFLQMWEDDCDGDGNAGWSDWFFDDGNEYFDDPEEYLAWKNNQKNENKTL